MDTNAEIADTFDRLADLLELEEADQMRVRRYRTAARTIREHARNVAGLVKHGKNLSALPDIDATLAEKIETVVEGGVSPLLKRELQDSGKSTS